MAVGKLVKIIQASSPGSSPLVNLTNRFHVAVRLFSNGSQMTSKCGKNKNVVHEAIAECVTDVKKLTFRALALRQSEWRNCGLCVGLHGESRATLLVGI